MKAVSFNPGALLVAEFIDDAAIEEPSAAEESLARTGPPTFASFGPFIDDAALMTPTPSDVEREPAGPKDADQPKNDERAA